MIALDEDSIICDFAETYKIYNIYDFPVEYIAILAKGLRENSRIKLKESGLKVDIFMLLLAHIVDNTAINIYAKTKDAKTGRNKPVSFVEIFTKEKDPKDKPREFISGSDFEKEWRRLSGGN